MNLVQLAQRIRSVRTDRQLTLEQLAERTGLTKSVLSKFENFRVTPSLGALGNIAEALGVTMSELLDGVDEKPRMVVVRKDERLPLERDRPASRIRYNALAHTRRDKVMEPFLLEVPTGVARSRRLAHEGEEFIMVLSGSIDYEYGDERLRLDVGDCMYADGSVEHTLNNPGDDTAEVLVVWVSRRGGKQRCQRRRRVALRRRRYRTPAVPHRPGIGRRRSPAAGAHRMNDPHKSIPESET